MGNCSQIRNFFEFFFKDQNLKMNKIEYFLRILKTMVIMPVTFRWTFKEVFFSKKQILAWKIFTYIWKFCDIHPRIFIQERSPNALNGRKLCVPKFPVPKHGVVCGLGSDEFHVFDHVLLCESASAYPSVFAIHCKSGK